MAIFSCQVCWEWNQGSGSTKEKWPFLHLLVQYDLPWRGSGTWQLLSSLWNCARTVRISFGGKSLGNHLKKLNETHSYNYSISIIFTFLMLLLPSSTLLYLEFSIIPRLWLNRRKFLVIFVCSLYAKWLTTDVIPLRFFRFQDGAGQQNRQVLYSMWRCMLELMFTYFIFWQELETISAYLGCIYWWMHFFHKSARVGSCPNHQVQLAFHPVSLEQLKNG